MNQLVINAVIAGIDAYIVNGNRNALVAEIEGMTGIAPEDFPAAIRGIRIKQDADTQAAIDKARQGPIPE